MCLLCDFFGCVILFDSFVEFCFYPTTMTYGNMNEVGVRTCVHGSLAWFQDLTLNLGHPVNIPKHVKLPTKTKQLLCPCQTTRPSTKDVQFDDIYCEECTIPSQFTRQVGKSTDTRDLIHIHPSLAHNTVGVLERSLVYEHGLLHI